MSTLRRKMAFGAAWMMSIRLVDRAIGLASTVILARVLVPADFGIVAMAMGVVALLELLSAFGLDTAIIQRPNIDLHHYNTAWTFGILLGCFVAVGLLLLAWPVANFYQQPPLAWVLVALAPAAAIQGFENIGLVAFRRDLNFRADFLIMACKRLILFGITISLAFLLRSYWALVIGIVGGRTLGVALSYIVHPYRPRFSLSARRDLFGFSQWVLSTNILTFALQRCSDVIVGRTLGPPALGLYNVGAELAALPSSELVAPINRAVFPGFAKLANDRHALRHEYFAFIGFIAMIALPAAVGVASIAHLIVPLVLGPKWLDAIGIVKVMALAGTLQVLQTTNYAVYLGVGRPSRQVVTLCVQLTVLIPAMLYLSSAHGIVGAAYAFALASAASFPVTLAMVLREIRAQVRDFVRAIWRPAIGAAVMYLALQSSTAPPALSTTAQLLVRVVESIAFGAALYVAMVLICWLVAGRPDATETTIFRQVAEIIERSVRRIRGLAGPARPDTDRRA